ncbi:hypothetical protein [Streptomyces rishiriensis]|uniref:Beta-phosphoglucomutase-like phosphatase (HAD superfamily) n=1 Tax=Streptomyces rishiriensis TaxID=68264 RepID=A0ABU0NJG6_STRRH|nr:hypothetical protein [Streptomyces rishiriensis]MDQ0578710.1 beta-phosphoglucomutase-like phosphatase (HAD superfamily) [Streptomyces rishiriensis]
MSVTDAAIAVLDTDGTLIDSDYRHGLAWYRALRSGVETCAVWRLHRRPIVRGGDQLVTAVRGEELERRVGDRARKQQGTDVDALLEKLAPPRVARDLLVAPRERGHWLMPAGSGRQRPVEGPPQRPVEGF